MTKIIWLASYPKSGNTWMRILLANYLHESEQPVDINALTLTGIASSRLLFDEWAGVEASALNLTTIERLRPEVYRCLAREASEPIFMKVHDGWRRTDRGESLFPTDVTAGVVYLLRNPLDVTVSCAHHLGIDIELQLEQLCDPNFGLPRVQGDVTDQIYQHLGAWSDHVESWIDRSDLPLCVVRYEDLRRDTVGVFDKVVRFCGLPYDEARVRKAVAYSDFKELQRQEQEAGFRERPPTASAQFFRRGKAGAWRDELGPEVAQRIIATHGAIMRRFGYLNEGTESQGRGSE
jgi:hypothetical protein